jgi:(heptosyl)LPS beta-1,4-glucosyltransferase
MRLGCFVIHGNARDTLGPCLDDLAAVGDEVVAVSSGDSDGSSELVRARGHRSITVPWAGYGASRAAAAQVLGTCDYLFFLDADETLRPGGREAIAAWKRSGGGRRYYRLRRYDWAELSEGRFLFRTEWKKRLVRIDGAVWTPAMVVHEALPDSPDTGVVDAGIDHRFAATLDGREEKDERYALLWAVQSYCEGRRSTGSVLSAPVHWLRNAVVKGALARGGAEGARLSWTVARYHARKREILRDIAGGAHADLVAAYRSGDYAGLLARTARPGTRPGSPA